MKVPVLWRLRAHPPTFDWAEARRRVRRGETHASVARSMGVDRRSVNRVVKMSEAHVREAMKMTDPERRAALVGVGDKVPCPRCGRPKSRSSTHCRDCANDIRIDNAPMELVRVPGQRRAILSGVPLHRIVKVNERWGVVCRTTVSDGGRYREVDFWEGGREQVLSSTVVEVAPSTRIMLAGEVQKDDNE